MERKGDRTVKFIGHDEATHAWVPFADSGLPAWAQAQAVTINGEPRLPVPFIKRAQASTLEDISPEGNLGIVNIGNGEETQMKPGHIYELSKVYKKQYVEKRKAPRGHGRYSNN
jgi:hypothetical protein